MIFRLGEKMKRLPLVIALVVPIFLAGCVKPVHFPTESISDAAKMNKAYSAFDGNGDGKADFFTFTNKTGRIDRIAYDITGNELADEIINLDAIEFGQARHLVIILDGFSYDTVKKYRDDGGLRMFHEPSRVISPYPSMTDLAMEDIFGYMPCRAIESKYYDRRANKLLGGSADYLAGVNEPYNNLLHYRANLLWDAIGYIDSWAVFGKEINDAKRVFNRGETQEILTYFVSSAGVGTRKGAEGQIKCLQKIEQMVNQILWETRGLTKITLLSDHGHSYTPAKRIELEKHLKEKGWRLRNSLKKPEDVVFVRFGLVTFASFSTQQPAVLAHDLIAAEGVELASFVEKEAVVVLGKGGQLAKIHRGRGEYYKYETINGDPLKIKSLLDSIKGDSNGFNSADDLLNATGRHIYPAPLQRIWRAHFSQVQNPPDVIVSLGDNYFSGDASFAGSVSIASTHGSLNYSSSATFIMATIGPLPQLMRSRDVSKNMKLLSGQSWPLGK